MLSRSALTSIALPPGSVSSWRSSRTVSIPVAHALHVGAERRDHAAQVLHAFEPILEAAQGVHSFELVDRRAVERGLLSVDERGQAADLGAEAVDLVHHVGEREPRRDGAAVLAETRLQLAVDHLEAVARGGCLVQCGLVRALVDPLHLEHTAEHADERVPLVRLDAHAAPLRAQGAELLHEAGDLLQLACLGHPQPPPRRLVSAPPPKVRSTLR